MTNKTAMYIVFGSIAGIMIMIIAAYYWYYVKKSHTKIMPTKEQVFV
jgi:H+/gluconate symporter-like permease